MSCVHHPKCELSHSFILGICFDALVLKITSDFRTQTTWFAFCFRINPSLFIKYSACLCAFQSSTQEFYLISGSLSRLGQELQALLPAIQSQISSALLRGLLLDTPDLLAPAHSFLKVLNEKAAKWVSSKTGGILSVEIKSLVWLSD